MCIQRAIEGLRGERSKGRLRTPCHEKGHYMRASSARCWMLHLLLYGMYLRPIGSGLVMEIAVISGF